MAVNRDKPDRWKADVAQSIDMYNTWFINFAPATYRATRNQKTKEVEDALIQTSNLTNIEPTLLYQHPAILPMLRMTTAPPMARDRLIGLASVSKNLVEQMELEKRIPPTMERPYALRELEKIGHILERLADKDLFPWLEDKHVPNERELFRAASVVADRLCGADTNPIIRNAQELRQLQVIAQWLAARGYVQLKSGAGIKYSDMRPGTFSFRLNIPVILEDGRKVNIPIDTVIMPKMARTNELPLLIEAKSAGDFTNTNKRRKEEATKFAQLQRSYGQHVRFVLFLCGYFDASYLGYEASEGIDWVWEHRIDDLAEFGV